MKPRTRTKVWKLLKQCAANLPSLPAGSSYMFSDETLKEVGGSLKNIPLPNCNHRIVKREADRGFMIVKMPEQMAFQ